ncbi:MAG TPA: hypothetical protein VE967_11225 [Gemmatimonadaceae bacterium]|nr:hypothetical protein [Gemmatimonadaceae bacterium]
MYATCLFCNHALGRNESIEHFTVGSRLAFDAAHGRLWVICPQCGRWNLTPLEERWEAIEECERAFAATFVRVSTDNIGLAKLSSGLELVRIGSPLRPEFAAWRYGRQFRARRRRINVVATAGAAGAVVAGGALVPSLAAAATLAGPLSLFLLPGISMVLGSIPVLGVIAAREYVDQHRVIARFRQKQHVLTVRAKHLDDIEMHFGGGSSGASMVVHHDGGWREFAGAEAMQATSVILANTNRFGADDKRISSAVTQIERAGDAEGFLAEASGRNGWRGGKLRSILNEYRGLGAFKLSSTERLALEMAVHEETERRAMHGELAVLESAWRDAEVIAHIADSELTELPLTELPRQA